MKFIPKMIKAQVLIKFSLNNSKSMLISKTNRFGILITPKIGRSVAEFVNMVEINPLIILCRKPPSYSHLYVVHFIKCDVVFVTFTPHQQHRKLLYESFDRNVFFYKMLSQLHINTIIHNKIFHINNTVR